MWCGMVGSFGGYGGDFGGEWWELGEHPLLNRLKYRDFYLRACAERVRLVGNSGGKKGELQDNKPIII